MAWVAADRFLKLSVSRKTQDVRRQKRIARLRDLIHETVCRDGFHRQRNSFGESFGADTVDASLLLLPAVGFLPVSDPRIAGTIAAVETDLIYRLHLLARRLSRDARPQSRGPRIFRVRPGFAK